MPFLFNHEIPPKKIRKITPSNKFYVSEVELDRKTNYFKDKIHISRDVDRVKFKRDYAFLGNPDNIFIEVTLDVTDENKWISLSNENEISFTNLSPGVHTLYIRKIKPFTSEYEIKK